ncbi:membrane protein [Bacteroidia bacterium]|nr:membrane protein [Bacteroidia bacterium]
MPATSAFLLSIVDTNWNETSEVLTSVRIPLILLGLFWIFYFWVVFRKIENRYFFSSKKIRFGALGIFLIILFAGYSHHYSSSLLHFRKIYPYDLILRFYQVCATKQEIHAGEKQLQNFRFEAQKADSLNEKEIYVFVIGETGRYSSYSINGYARNTSPMLAQVENLVTYSDFFSEANITSSSLPMILTRATPMAYNRFYVEKSFVDAFREAGFKTYWIANQSGENPFIRRIAHDTDQSFFMENERDAQNNYDEKLWPFLEEVLRKDDKKVLIVLHTLGSHFRYNFRYPSNFEVFKPCLAGAFDIRLISSKNKQQFINTYDNSILYTDFFLATTIQKIDSLHCISSLVYVADHGENLFDTPENVVMHGGSYFTEYDFHVPFFVWTSGKYNLHYPEKVENLQQNKDKKLSAGNIFYSILDMADITFPEQQLQKSIASDRLQEDSVRYVINTNMEMKRGY